MNEKTKMKQVFDLILREVALASLSALGQSFGVFNYTVQVLENLYVCFIMG